MANSWLTLVKKTFDEGRKSDEHYSYKQAMMDAKKSKNSSSKRGGGGEEMGKMGKMDDGDVMEYGNAADVSTDPVGGKSRKSKKSKKSAKKSKKAGKKSKKTRKARK